MFMENPFELVLLDHRMPDMDGIELTRQINAAEIPVTIIVMSAYGSVESAIEAMKAGKHVLTEKLMAQTVGKCKEMARVAKETDGRTEYRIRNVPPGAYALVVHYDENNDGQIDKNFIGIPREPIAFSNGYRPKGPPSYRRAEFALSAETPRTEIMTLERVLGKRGRIGVGLGVVARSSPYRDYSGIVAQPIPVPSRESRPDRRSVKTLPLRLARIRR